MIDPVLARSARSAISSSKFSVAFTDRGTSHIAWSAREDLDRSPIARSGGDAAAGSERDK